MPPSIRGHQGSIKFFKAGVNCAIIELTNVEINQDSNFSRSQYVGQKIPEGDQTIDGYSGSADVEVKGPEVDDLIDAMTENNLAGVGVEEFTMVAEEHYPDGTIRAYVYYDGQVKMSKRHPNQTEKMTKKLDFQFSGRIQL